MAASARPIARQWRYGKPHPCVSDVEPPREMYLSSRYPTRLEASACVERSYGGVVKDGDWIITEANGDNHIFTDREFQLIRRARCPRRT